MRVTFETDLSRKQGGCGYMGVTFETVLSRKQGDAAIWDDFRDCWWAAYRISTVGSESDQLMGGQSDHTCGGQSDHLRGGQSDQRETVCRATFASCGGAWCARESTWTES